MMTVEPPVLAVFGLLFGNIVGVASVHRCAACVTEALRPYAGTTMAVFSSNGPTWDGRIKPDILAPGWTLSAQTGQTDSDSSGDAFHCHVHDSVGSMEGTSMSTPGAYCKHLGVDLRTSRTWLTGEVRGARSGGGSGGTGAPVL